jgi:quinoprotein glucose dehydrogenase
VVEGGRLRPAPWATVPVEATGEAGLTALALAPDLAASGPQYVLATVRGRAGLENQVLRLTERAGQGVEARVVVAGLPSERFHAGGALDFGPDGMLYVTTGDAREPRRAQDPLSLAGKLLRYRADGTIPPDNPTPGSPVWALGLRNTQGLAWHPESGDLLATEHGPSGFPDEGFRQGRDELNHLRRGANYGWPEEAGRGGGDRFVEPVVAWSPAIAPSGLDLYSGDAIPAWRGSAFVGALRGKHLRRMALERGAGGWRVTAQEELFGELGRVRAVKMGPDGSLYFATSNRDGRGGPAADDDRVLRLVPRR